ASVIETHGFYDQRIALDAADRMPVPSRRNLERVGKRPPVHPDLPPVVTVFEELKDPVRGLHDFESRMRSNDLGVEVAHESRRLASSHRIVPLHLAPRSVTGLRRQKSLAALRGERGLLTFELRPANGAGSGTEGFNGGHTVPVAREIMRIEVFRAASR